MIKDPKRFTMVIMLSALLLTAICCGRHGRALEDMDKAEMLMGTSPDSSLLILNEISVTDLRGEEELARYSLLKSMALDKNCIDTTTLEIIKPAMEYYEKHGSSDEKFRTYYYYGRIYQNQGKDDEAMTQFMKAADLKNEIRDSLLLAHNLVAMGTLYYKQYKLNKFIETNIEAAKIYESKGKRSFAISSYSNAIDGYIMTGDKPAADSIFSICLPLTVGEPEDGEYLFSSILLYTIEFGNAEQIKTLLKENKELESDQSYALNFAQGYSKIGEFDRAISILSNVKIGESILDSLKLLSVKTFIYEQQGDYGQAFKLFKEYSVMSERYQYQLLSQDLLFADKRHQLEVENLVDLQTKNRIIRGFIYGSLSLLLLVGWFYYSSRLSYKNKMLAEKEKENLMLAQENLNKEKENLELEAANLTHERNQLEGERDNLKDLLEKQTELSVSMQDIIKMRLNMLNSILAKEITNNEIYAQPYNKWIESIKKDKTEFMNSTRIAFCASHPRFIGYLEQHDLSIDEINYACLYAIGLRGKEVGEYIRLKRHYNISSEIRKKLGLDEHTTNIGLYIRKIMNEV